MKKTVFFLMLLFTRVNGASLEETVFHSIALENFEEIIRYSSKRDLYRMKQVCKSVHALSSLLIKKYESYEYVISFVKAAKENNDMELKNSMKELYTWGCEDIFDWVPRIIPQLKFFQNSYPNGLETLLIKGGKRWADKQDPITKRLIKKCRNKYMSSLKTHKDQIKNFFKSSDSIIAYYCQIKDKDMDSFDCKKCANLISFAANESIKECNLFITRLLMVQNKNIKDMQSITEDTPLTLAIRNKNMPVIRLLLQYKSSVNLANSEGYTPLILAIFNSDITVITLLLEHTADINLPDRQGYTPLMWAVQERHIEIMRLLLQYKPNLFIKNKYGITALELSPTENIKNILLNYLQASSS